MWEETCLKLTILFFHSQWERWTTSLLCGSEPWRPCPHLPASPWSPRRESSRPIFTPALEWTQEKVGPDPTSPDPSPWYGVWCSMHHSVSPATQPDPWLLRAATKFLPFLLWQSKNRKRKLTTSSVSLALPYKQLGVSWFNFLQGPVIRTDPPCWF